VVAGAGQYETDLDDSLTQLEMYQGLVGTDEKRGRGPATATTKGCIKITKPTAEGGTPTTINGVDVWTYAEFTKEVKPGYWLSDYRRGNATSANVINYYAQPSFDRVELGFGTSQSVALSMLKTFGGEVHGIVSDDATGPAVGVVVNADQASAEFDHDDTDAFGFFEMPAETTAIAEYRGDVETSVYPELEPTNVGVVTPGFGECWLHRFGLVAPGGSPARGKDTVLDNAAGMVTRVVGRSDGNLYLDLFTISTNSWTTPEAISRGLNPSLAWYGATREAVVSMTYVVDGDLKERTSADFGRNWGVELDLGFAGTHPEMLFDPSSGVTYLFYITSSNVYVKRRDRPDGTYSAAVLVASTVTDDDLSAKLLSGTRAGTIQVHYTLGSGNIAVVTSADFGATWS
jgi:hypothetical protein